MVKYNYKMELIYDGSRYKGWQRLKNEQLTIQGKIEDILSINLDCEIKIVGSGRTDAGVHAKGQVANFWTNKEIDPEYIFRILNKYLPEDISCTHVCKVDERFHSRYNAKKKHYRYIIQNGSFIDPFTRKYAWYVDEILDLEKMREASKVFEGTIDFSSFTNLKSKKKSKVRTIYSIKIDKKDSNIVIDFFGDGFLQHMVRILVGTIVEVGKNQIDIVDVKRILELKKRSEQSPLAPAKGLCLERVYYKE